ncbi:MAG TPA: DsbE family thiol:disulfide interchange protein [Rhizomicrobium sp.]|nr:DsbE family thiol:disulfide interchange protein [Rhizomicrobium sp.]
MKRLFYILPVLVFLGLAIFLLRSLKGPPPAEIPSVLVDHPAPRLTLPPLDTRTQGLRPADLAQPGRVTLVNIFASWCIPCREEAPQLAQLARARGVRLIGIAYKDKPEAARAFLDEVGNPFERVALDADGRAGIEWGTSGVPETFVIDGHGIVRARFGPLSADNLVLELLPAIASAASR